MRFPKVDEFPRRAVLTTKHRLYVSCLPVFGFSRGLIKRSPGSEMGIQLWTSLPLLGCWGLILCLASDGLRCKHARPCQVVSQTSAIRDASDTLGSRGLIRKH